MRKKTEQKKEYIFEIISGCQPDSEVDTWKL